MQKYQCFFKLGFYKLLFYETSRLGFLKNWLYCELNGNGFSKDGSPKTEESINLDLVLLKDNIYTNAIGQQIPI
jgi:hypothetical protein